MRSGIFAILFWAAIAPATAQTWTESQKPVVCGPFREIVTTLTKEPYQEFPLWIGTSSEDSSRFSLFVNTEKGNWTLVQYGTNTGCILGIGVTGEIFKPDSFRKSY